MKSRYQYVLMLVMFVATAWVYSSCSDDSSGSEPKISYIRITDPESSDSLLTAGLQGATIAIIGENLGGAKEIWFNDRPGSLSPVYITDRTIITAIPSKIPTEITDKLTIVFSGGKTLEHEFRVAISEPVVSSMKSEYVNEGKIAYIRGSYFYEPITVTFEGGVTGEVLDVGLNNDLLEVIVPAGAQSGPVTVTTNFGETQSDFFFRDNRNLFLTNDPWSGWWGGDLVVNASDPLAINGNFTRITKQIGGWAWTEMLGGPPDALGDISKNIPDEAVTHPEDFYLKFEVNTIKPYNGNRIKIMLGQVTNPDPNWDNEPYYWEAPYDTKGEWQTVIIPFEDVVANFASWTVRPGGYGVKIWFHGPGALDADMAFDNFRVVPKVAE